MRSAQIRMTARLAAPVTVVALALGALSAMMGTLHSTTTTTLYVDGDAAIDGNGTALSPFNNLASLQDAMYAASLRGITAYFSGTFYGQKLSVQQPMNYCELKQWPDRPQAVIRGDTIVTETWTQDVPGLRYSIAIGPGTDVVGVVEDWDIRVDAQGRHYGHLTRVSSTSEVEAGEGTWFYDGVRLHIHAINNENPNINGREYGWGIGGNGFYLLSSRDSLVEGLHFKLWLDPDPGEGYGVYMGGAERCVMRNCLANDYGYHGFGFVGLWCRDNTFDRCVTRGGRANGSTAYIFYAFTDPTATLAGCRAYDCEAHLYRHLDVHGQAPPYAPNKSADGFYIHTNGAMITDVEYHRCVAYGYENRHGYGFAVGETSIDPTDYNDPETYPIRFYECRLVDGVTNDINGGSSAAFVRCSFDLQRMSEVLPANVTAVTTYTAPAPTRLLFESCEFKVNTDGQPWSSFFSVASSVGVNFRGCVIYDDGQSTDSPRAFLRLTGSTASVSASQTVFAHRTPQRLVIAHAPLMVSPAMLLLRDCWYWQINPAGGYTPNRSFDTQAEFQAVIDPAGVYDVNPQFADAPEDLEGVQGGPLATTTLLVPGVHRFGINELSYDGRYGAYQYGPVCPADFDGSGVVNGLDLAKLLAAWGSPPKDEQADLNSDGAVDGLDLGLLLGSWGACR